MADSSDRKMYAIDGQHRLSAIQTIMNHIDPNGDFPKPDGFENEIVSVIFVPVDDDDDDTYRNQKYRRLFLFK